MDDQIDRPAPRELTDALDASVRDIATGAVGDAGAAQQRARGLLADFEQAHPGSPAGTPGNSVKRARTTA